MVLLVQRLLQLIPFLRVSCLIPGPPNVASLKQLTIVHSMTSNCHWRQRSIQTKVLHHRKGLTELSEKVMLNSYFQQSRNVTRKKVQTIADGGDSDITHTELDYVAMEKTPEPLEVDYSEAVQIHQTVHCPLLTYKDVVSCSERSQGIIEVPVKFLDLLSVSLFSDKVEEMLEPMADSNSPEDRVPPPFVSPVGRKNVIVASGNDLEQKGKENTSTEQITREVHREAKERTCMIQVTKEDKGKALSCIDKKAEDSNFHASIMDCLELFFKEEVIEARCEKCSKGPQQPSTIGSKDGVQTVASTIDFELIIASNSGGVLEV
ncbi:hypothetical protein EJB05_10179, partial [Eragrostis curvula]